MNKTIILYIGIVKQFIYRFPVSSLLKCLLALIINEFAALLVRACGTATIPLVSDRVLYWF